MGLKQENFVDRVFITVTATGAAATGLSPTCTFVDESDNRTAGTVAEMGNGWYKITDFTPDADGTWCTEWAVAGAYTIHYPFKEFKVGGGQEADIKAETALIKTETDKIPTLLTESQSHPTLAEIEAGDMAAIKTETDKIATLLTESQSHPTLAEIEASNLDAAISTRAPANEYDTEMARITANVATEAKQDIIDTNVDDIETDTADMQPRIPRITCHMDFWSDIQEEAQLSAGGETGVVALPDVVVADLPAGVTITRVIAMFICRAIENTNASVNAVDVATGHIEVRDDTPGTWTTAINIPDNAFGVAASTREMGTVLIGDNDISGEVDGNDTYNFEFDDVGTDQDNLNFNDVQCGLRVYFTV